MGEVNKIITLSNDLGAPKSNDNLHIGKCLLNDDDGTRAISEAQFEPMPCNLYTGKNFSNNTQNVTSWLQQYKVSKGKTSSHTLMTGGNFLIPDDQLITLYQLLSVNQGPLSLTEKHLPEYSPMVIDFDFKFKTRPIPRAINDHLITMIVDLYHKHLRELEITDDNCFITVALTRIGGYFEKNLFKDGFHLQMPFMVIDYDSQYEIRRRVINDLIQMKDFPKTENSLDDVVDISVIQRNNWLLYSCCKPNLPPYQIRRVYTTIETQLIYHKLKDSIFNQFTSTEMITLLSLRCMGDRVVSKEHIFPLYHQHQKKKNITVPQHVKKLQKET